MYRLSVMSRRPGDVLLSELWEYTSSWVLYSMLHPLIPSLCSGFLLLEGKSHSVVSQESQLGVFPMGIPVTRGLTPGLSADEAGSPLVQRYTKARR